jgi:phage FluMu protein Com
MAPRIVEEARCPECNKLLGKNVGQASLYCERCKVEREFGADYGIINGREKKTVRRDTDGNIVEIVTEST